MRPSNQSLRGRLALPIRISQLLKTLSLLVILPLWSDMCRGEQAPTDGITRFCLQHKTSRQVLRGCKGTLLPKARAVTAICTDPSSKGTEKLRQTVARPWSVIPAGADYCNPCDPPAPQTGRVPRGDPLDQLEPKDGCLWVYGVGDEQAIAFSDRGLESLQEIIAEHKRSSLTRGP
jgi:hypothetical protein